MMIGRLRLLTIKIGVMRWRDKISLHFLLHMQNNLSTHTILDYEDVLRAQPGNSDEQLVDVRKYDSSIVAEYEKQDMVPWVGTTILVRDTLARKLAIVNSELFQDKKVRLKIVYGYRHPDIQKKYFDQRMIALKAENPHLTDEQLTRLAHNFVAVIDVAGHPTGGAVDLMLIDANGMELPMGTRIADYADAEKIKTFASGLTVEQINNRALLHDVMIRQGFAPFYGEWWHFSYGDREWAAFYDKKIALYGTIELNS